MDFQPICHDFFYDFQINRNVFLPEVVTIQQMVKKGAQIMSSLNEGLGVII